MRIIDIVATAAFTFLNTKGKKDILFTINVYNLWYDSTFLIVHSNSAELHSINLRPFKPIKILIL